MCYTFFNGNMYYDQAYYTDMVYVVKEELRNLYTQGGSKLNKWF